MDYLDDIYYLAQLIVQQFLIFLQDFIFREFTWFTPTKENFDNTDSNFDNTDSKILDVLPQHPVSDLFVLFTVCGLVFAFTILSNSPKNETSNHDIDDTISMTFENDPSSLWYSNVANSSLISYFHTCNSVNPSRDMIFKEQNISQPTFSKCRSLPLQSKTLNCSARSIYSHSQRTQGNYFNSQKTSREWLIRRTRSGHVYGKYPICENERKAIAFKIKRRHRSRETKKFV